MSPSGPGRGGPEPTSARRPVVHAGGLARRRVVAGALALVALVALAWQNTSARDPVTVGLAALVTAAGAATLASYVPRHGWRPTLGCTPCAAVSAASVPVAVGLLASGAAGVAAVVALAGLGQRLRTGGATCAT